MCFLKQRVPFVVSLIALVGLGCATSSSRITPYRIRDGALVQGSDKMPVYLYAVDIPGLIRPETSTADMVRAINHVSEVGANAVCFDLWGISGDGKAVAPEAVQKLTDTVRQVTWRKMGAICRVLPEGISTDANFRAAAVRSAAAALRKNRDVLYWIDGPDAQRLTAAFKSVAPRLVVISPNGGDLQTTSDPAVAKTRRLAVLVGKIPDPADGDVNYIVPGSDAMYAALDKALADPIETQPWVPDNSVLSAEERADGWIALFDGKSLDGWTIPGRDKTRFTVRNGAIEWVPPVKGKRPLGLLRSRDRYENFILRLEWKIAKDQNSGVMLRAPRSGRTSKIGMEFQLMGDYGETPITAQTTGAIYAVVPPLKNASKPAGEWNSLEITVNGAHLKALLNGELVQDTDLESNEELKLRLRRGFIGLQDHHGPVAYRNIRLKPL